MEGQPCHAENGNIGKDHVASTARSRVEGIAKTSFVTHAFAYNGVISGLGGPARPGGRWSHPTRFTGLDLSAEDVAELVAVDTEAYKADLEEGEAFLAKFGDKVPARLKDQVEAQKARVG
jgi:hypothetical protein